MPMPWKAVPLAGLAVAALVLAACPPEVECENYSDCPSGQTCDRSSKQCVDDNVPVGGGGGGYLPPFPDDGGTGPGAGTVQIRTDYPVPWMERDVRPSGQGHIFFHDLLTEIDEGYVVDRVRTFDPDTGRIDPSVFVDFLQTPTGACRIERLLFIAGTDPDETWLSCREEPGLRVVYQSAFSQASYDLSGARVELDLHTVPESGNELPRILVTTRGSTAIRTYQLRSDDGVGTGHPNTDAFPPVGAAAALFLLDRTTLLGDHVLVFDRRHVANAATSPALVPFVRDPQAEVWRTADALSPLLLPANTHHALLLGPVRASGQTPTQNTANVMSIETVTGTARYWKYETAQELLPPTRFETDARFLIEAPPANERVLVALSPSGGFAFYTFSMSSRIWRIPTRPGADNDVRVHDLFSASWRPSALVVEDEDSVWISYSNENLIERVDFQEP